MLNDHILQDINEIAEQASAKPFLNLTYYVSHTNETKLYMEKAFELYAHVTASILDWCGAAMPLLQAYHHMIDDDDYDKSRAQSNDLIKLLTDGIAQIHASQMELSESRVEFNNFMGNIVELQLRIIKNFNNKTADFRETNREFYEELENKLKNLESHISDIKREVKSEIQVITDLKVQISKTKSLIALDAHPDLRNAFHTRLIQFTSNSIMRCEAYQRLHK